jgi:hypothetical protein
VSSGESLPQAVILPRKADIYGPQKSDPPNDFAIEHLLLYHAYAGKAQQSQGFQIVIIT